MSTFAPQKGDIDNREQDIGKSQQTKNPLRKKYAKRSLNGSLAFKDCSVSVIPLARQRQVVETPDFSCGPR